MTVVASGTRAFGSVEIYPADTCVRPGFGIQLRNALVVFHHLAIIISQQLYPGTVTLPATAGGSRVGTVIDRNTVLILGAGSSKPYGLPLGFELRDEVLRAADDSTRLLVLGNPLSPTGDF